jgi:hypothetical protein
MAFSDNNNVPVNSVNKDKYRNSATLLPLFFRTEANKKFLGSTLDTLISKGQLEKINGYVGSRYAKTVKPNDRYITEPTSNRRRYNLLPSVVIRDEFDDRTEWLATYDDLINQLDFFNGNTENHNKLFSSKYYAWNPHIDFDKISNYRQYYWLPQGPSPVTITGLAEGSVSSFNVTNQNSSAWVFTPDGSSSNPVIKLYRGATYKFEVNAPGHPFYIKLARTTGDLDQYEDGITNNGTENGAVVFTIPKGAPDILYYTCGNHQEMQGIFEIRDAVDELNIDIPTEILGKKEYTSSNGVVFTNGLKVNFTGDVTPSRYKNKNFYVDGVGKEIVLLPVSEFDTPEGYSQNFDYEFDIESFDETPYDDAESSAETPEYVTINRASIDKNPWSRYNRWFHKEVIEVTAKYNNTNAVFDEDSRAKRPIIEFLPNIQLYDFATQALGNIDLIDTVTTDAFSEIEGHIGYYIDEVDLVKGMRVTFNADPDITVRGKIYEVDFVNHGGQSRIHLKEVETATQGHGLVVTNGTNNKGTSWYYNGSDWLKGQQKTELNQAPKFDLFDASGVSFTDTKYGVQNFQGNELVSYKIGTGENDPVLGFPIEYQNVANIGDITFEFDWDDKSFTYTENGVSYVQDTAAGVIKVNKSLTESVFESGWSLVENKLNQRIIQLNDTVNPTTILEITAIKDPGLYLTEDDIIVEYSGNILKPQTGFTLSRSNNNKKLFLNFNETILADNRLVTKIKTDRLPTQFGFYEPPVNLLNNSENNDLQTFTLGSVSSHVQTIFENDIRVEGKFNNTSNARDVSDLYKFGNRYVKHQGSLLPAIFGLVDAESNVIKSIRKNALDYSVFKQQFLQVFEATEVTGNPADDVDAMLYSMSLNKNTESAYYYSDMAGFGRSLTKTEYTVNAFEQQIFGIQSNYNLTEISNRSVYVYFNGEHLINNVDYEFDATDNTVLLKRETAIGDVVKIYDYNTVGNIIPSTPTKLGLYPKFTPVIYTDDTYVTPTKIIQGHDGSKTVAYDDYRDELILELEKRIYNNIKVEYKRNVFDNNEFLPGAFRKTEFNVDQVTKILTDDFNYWANLYGVDYLNNLTSVEGEVFSYNLSSAIDTVNSEKLPGYWKGIYKKFFDTDRPHTAPWEMLGYSEKPTWWEDRYGPAPYTKGNNILWQDLEKGFDYGLGKVNPIYTREGLSKNIPVNDYGELLSPIQTNLVSGFITTNLNNNWVFGDYGPAEYAWRSSSWYPYVQQILLALLKPANYLTIQYDTSQNLKSLSDNVIYKDTGKIIDFTDTKVHNLFYNNERYFGAGYHVFVVDYLKSKDQNVLEAYADRLSKTSMNVTYKTGAFVNKERLKVLLESSNPNTPDKSIFLPDENFEITFRKSNPVFTANISGIIVEKVDNGYLVKGYDRYSPSFKIYKPILSQQNQAVNVGGVSANFVIWQEEKFYGTAQIVQYEDSYYRVKEDHTTNQTFDPTLYTRLQELPLTGGASVQKPTMFEETVSEIPYQTVLPNKQEVYNLLLGYEKYLTSIGFEFNNVINELGEVSDWSLSGKEFLYWTTQNFAKGSVITLAPFARKVEFKFQNGQVDNLLDSFYEYSIYNAGGNPISRNYISTIRESGKFQLLPKETQEGIFNAQLNLVQKEHVIVFDDKSVFGDIIYDQEAGYRQERIKFIGFKTTEWDGDIYSPGFVYDEAKIAPWASFKDYNLGDVVKYKSKYYSAKQFLPGEETFDYNKWLYLQNDPTAELLPNLDFKISSFQDFYNLDTEVFDEASSKLSQHLVGYQKRFYLDNLIQDNLAQYKFYQGYIKEKGTKNAIDAISRLKIDDVQTDITFDEEWAFNVGSLGSSATVKELEFALDERLNIENPQAYDFASSITANTTPGNNIQLLANAIAVKPADYDNNPWPVTTLDSTAGITSDYVNVLPVAGYPRIDDIPTTAFSFNDMIGSNIINQLDDSDLVWVAKDKDNDWNVYQLQTIPARVIQTDDVKTEFSDNEIILNTDIVHNLTQGQIISIKSFSEDVDNVYIVKRVTSTTQFVVDGPDASVTIEDSTSGEILEFISNRINQPDDINNIKNVTKIENDSLVYADDDGTGKWAVYQKTRAWKENKWGAPNLIEQQKFGYNITTANQGRTIVVAAPTLGDEGQIYILNREFNTGIETLQTTQGFAISFNSSDNIVSDAGIPALGSSLAISNDGTVLVAGASESSNFKGADDSTYGNGFRVSVGDFTVEPSPYSREGVVTLHTYDTEENLFKLNYVIGSSEPEDDLHFGASVLVSNTKLLVGAPGKTNYQGKVYIYDKTTRPDGSTLDWDLSDHHILSIPNSRDGDKFGSAMTATSDLSIIAVSAPGYEEQGDDSTANKGAVFIYSLNSNNEYQLLQTISSATFNEIDSGDSFGYAMDMSDNGNTLIVSAPYDDANAINSGAVYYFKKTGDDSSQNLYTYQQTIFSPLKAVQEQFGANVKLNETGTSFAVWSQHGKNRLETSFDKFTRLDDSSLEETTTETTFDSNSMNIIDENYASGTVYTYTLVNTKFVYGQQLSSDTTNEFDEFGRGLAFIGNSLMVGAPNSKVSATNLTPIGSLFVYQKTGSGGWNKLRSQTQPTNPYSVKKAFTYNTLKNEVKDFLETLDPVKGKIPGLAEAEISYKSSIDPASYTQGSGTVTVKPTTAWTENHVGEVWWDLSTVAYVWYEQGDTEYRKANWGTLFPGSTIDVYEWVESTLKPSQWAELSATGQGFASGISGTPKYGDDTVVIKNIYNRTTSSFERRYYFWVKNKVDVPNLENRNLPVVEVANIITDPQAYGIKSIQLLNKNSLSLSNIKTTLDDKNIFINIQYREVETDLPEHNEWQIIGENQYKKIDNELLVKKLIDSAVGYDSQGNPVPDTALPVQRKYGLQIRPRQSIFVNRLSALKELVTYVNNIMIKNRIVDTKNIDALFEKDPLPAAGSGKWDIQIDDHADLSQVGTEELKTATATAVLKNGKIQSINITNPGFGYKNAPEILITGDGSGAKLKTNIDSNGKVTSVEVLKKGQNYKTVNLEFRRFRVLVTLDETANNNWAIYEWQAETRIWNRTNTQTFDLSRFWSYKDYIVDGFDIDSIINYKVSATYELNTISPNEGELVQVDNAGDGNKIILQKVIQNGSFSDEYDLMYKAKSTIQINTNIYNYEELNFGFAGFENYDVNLFDSEPITETRRILEIIRDDIFVDDLKDNWNKLFFIAIRYIFAEQNFVDWVFKTSFITVDNKLGGFSKKLNYKVTDPGYIERYVEEVKPYKTVIRNFYNSFNELETSNIGNTDFDLPSYWDNTNKKFVVPKITSDVITQEPYVNWFDNYKFKIGKINVTDDGAGYTEPPIVVISGGRTNKPAITETQQFRPLVTTDYTDSRFFVKTTSIPDHGFARNPGVNTVTAQDFTFEITRTPVEALDKVETPLGTIGVAVNGVVIFNPKAALTEQRGNVDYQINAVYSHDELGIDDGSGHPQEDGIYHYHSDPRLMYEKDPNNHSPLLGYALDGYPIYGPYGWDTTTGRSNPRVIKSSYRLKTTPRTDGSDPDGRYIEDFEYVAGLGDLDQHNGRTCNTPEYPNGIYAYFVTVDPTDTDVAVYPYIIGPTYYGAPILPNGNKTLPGEEFEDASAVAYTSRGIVREVVVTKQGSGYVSAPTVTLAGGGGANTVTSEAKAYAILENKKVRINTVNMKFDRIATKKVIQTQTQTDTFTATAGQIKFKLTYLPTLDKRKININIENETVYIENYEVSIVTVKDRTYKKQEGYIILNTPPGKNASVSIAYEKSISLMQATDRIDYYYEPTSGMAGKDPAQLMTGVDYDGVQVQGLEFDISVGWDGLPWFSHGWDTFSGTNTDYAFRADGTTTTFTLPYVPEQDQEINVYFDSVRQDPTNTPTIVGDGATDTFTLNIAAQDGTLVVFRQTESDGSLVPTDVNNLDAIIQGGNFSYSTATGTKPEDVDIDGDGFVTPDTSHAPEEVVPGQAFDSLSISIYNAPADGSPLIVTNRYFGNSLLRRYSFDLYPGTEDSVFVTVAGEYLENGTDYTIDFQNKEIVFVDAPEIDELVTIQTLNVGGANILERKQFTGDGSTTEFELTAKYEDVGSAFVTVDGVSKEYVIRESDTGSALIDVNNPPPISNSVIQITGLSTTEKTYSEIVKESIADDGSSTAYTMANIPGNIAPYHNMVIAEVKDLDTGIITRLLPPDTVYYVSNGVTQQYTVSQDPEYPVFQLALGEIEVYLNGAKLVPIRDFNFDTQTNLVTFNQNVLTSGDVIAITILKNHEYEINVTGDSAGDTESNLIIVKDRAELPTNAEYHVTTFTNHDSNLIRKEVFSGKLGGTYKLSRPAIDSNYVWVEVDGTPLVAERDYKILDNNVTVEIDNKFTVLPTSRITVTTFSEELSFNSIGYKVFNDMLNRTHFKRISEQDSTELAQDLNISDTEIVVNDASFFDTPSPSDKTPGVVWIDRERIEFYTISNNTLGQITRGTLGTGIKTVHTAGTKVFDSGPEQTVPYKETVNVYESIIRPGLPNGKKEHVLETVNISSSANAHDQVEVYLGGRKLQKPTVSTNPIKVHDIEIAYDSNEVDSDGVSSDVTQVPEFTIDPVADSSGKNYYKLTLRDEPQDGLELKVVQRQGRVWYEQSVNTASNGATLQRAETAQAKFLLERTSGLPVINIRE